MVDSGIMVLDLLAQFYYLSGRAGWFDWLALCWQQLTRAINSILCPTVQIPFLVSYANTCTYKDGVRKHERWRSKL